jgi:hypothetical protein
VTFGKRKPWFFLLSGCWALNETHSEGRIVRTGRDFERVLCWGYALGKFAWVLKLKT